MLRPDLAAAGGRTMLAPTTAAGYGAGPGAAPSKDYKPERFGFHPPETAVETRRDVERSILAACGVPPVLTNHAAPGSSMRGAFRQMTVGTIEPISVIVADQLSEALGVDVKLTMPRAAVCPPLPPFVVDYVSSQRISSAIVAARGRGSSSRAKASRRTASSGSGRYSVCSTQMFTYGPSRNGSLLCTCPDRFTVASGTSFIAICVTTSVGLPVMTKVIHVASLPLGTALAVYLARYTPGSALPDS